jgi:hypothetical protein
MAHISTAAGTLFYRITDYGTFSLLDKRDIHLIGQCCPICPLNINMGSETGMRPCVFHSPKVLLLKYGPLSKSWIFRKILVGDILNLVPENKGLFPPPLFR